MDDETKAVLEDEIRRPSDSLNAIQVELAGLDKQEGLAVLREICTPLAEELDLQIWANKWREDGSTWVVRWQPNAGNPKRAVSHE